MNNYKVLPFLLIGMVFFFSGCDTRNVTDTTQTMPARNWSYANKVTAVVDVKDSSQSYDIYFKLRHTADYRYANVFVLFHIKQAGKKQSRRYEYKLAQADGRWNGSGSGNLYTYTLPLLTSYRFPAPGKYQLEVEQNMRDNPLKEISDAGITVSKSIK